MTINSQSLRLSADVKALFAAAKGMKRVEGRVASNLDYMPYLEYGTTKMPARPVIAPNLAEYQAIIRQEIAEGFRQYPTNPQKAAEAGIAVGTLGIMREMADRTAKPAGPYFTGRAKNSWTAYLPGGRSPVNSGTPITAEQQRAILKARRIANRKKAERAAARAAKK